MKREWRAEVEERKYWDCFTAHGGASIKAIKAIKLTSCIPVRIAMPPFPEIN